jgi:hypothetical protein
MKMQTILGIAFASLALLLPIIAPPADTTTPPVLRIKNLTGARFRVTVNSVCYKGPHAAARTTRDMVIITETEEIQEKELSNYQRLLKDKESCLVHSAQFHARGTVCMIAYCEDGNCTGKACHLIQTDQGSAPGIILEPQENAQSAPLYIFHIKDQRFEIVREYPGTRIAPQVVYVSSELFFT